jgi:hypothetical protein
VKQDVAEWSQQVKDEGKNDIFEVKDGTSIISR